MALDHNKSCFVCKRDVVLRISPKEKTSKNALNHLLLGDYARSTGETQGEWVKVRSRNCTGWLKESWLTNERYLEINFVDIGQGDGCHVVTPDDEVILIDAGEGVGFDGSGGDNMTRFINWRYNLRNRKVAGVDGVAKDDATATTPFEIDYAIMSHPDLDHYYGFLNLFKNRKLSFKNVCHNGIVERPYNGANKKTWAYDLGRKAPATARSKYHLWDTVHSNKEMHDLIKANPTTRKFYLTTLREVRKNNSKVKFQFLDKSKGYLDHFNPKQELQMEVLAPITEEVTMNGETKACLPRIGSESVTKNGHSVVLKLKYKKIKILLGGDLNSDSQDYIAKYYSNLDVNLSDLEKTIQRSKEKLQGSDLSLADREEVQQELAEASSMLELIVTRTKQHFEADIAKACHHGASDVLDSFHRAINPIATVISSGDNESHSHPRPDALGSFGKAGRGSRPLIFSTELARSATEFSYPIEQYEKLKALEAKMNAATTKKAKEEFREQMEGLRDSNVAKYGMITVRTNGEQVIIAQKLEKERSKGQKWDIYELKWNEHLHGYEYKPKGGH